MQEVNKRHIYYNDKLGYVVRFNQKGLGGGQVFPTLELAEKYRDSVYEKMTELKIEKEKLKIQNEINKIKNEEKEFPFNLIKAMGIDSAVIDDVEPSAVMVVMNKVLKQTENYVAYQRYVNYLSVQEISDSIGITRQRGWQVLDTATEKLRRYYLNEKNKKDAIRQDKIYKEELKKSNELLDNYRKQILAKFLENGVYDCRCEITFGEVKTKTRVVKVDNRVSIDECDFSVRTYNCLKRYGVYYLDDLLAMEEFEIKKIKNLGIKSYKEIENKLFEFYGRNHSDIN